ncbi:MAG: hypothetical protein Q7J38_00690 [Gallionella sp.]|nr:hypothetical protein [Gallionella sp.]
MDIEIIAKLATVVGGVFAIYKGIDKLVDSKKTRHRDEYKFVKEFIADLEPSTHPFVLEKGYLAITGDATLGANEIRYLLSLKSPAQALRKYSRARTYVKFLEVPPQDRKLIIFRDEYQNSGKRKRAKRWDITLYIFFATFAFAPIVFAKELFGSNWQVAIVVIGMAAVSFGSLAITFLSEHGRICRAEELVAMQ